MTPEERRHVLEGFFMRAQERQARTLKQFRRADARAQREGLLQRWWDWRSVRLMERFHRLGKIVENAKAHLEHDARFQPRLKD